MVTIHSLYAPLLICSLSVSVQALAGDYRGELGAGYGKSNVDYDGFFSQETRTQSLMGTYYFTPVDTQNKPLAEAAFLGEHSYVSVGHSVYRSSWSWGDGDEVEAYKNRSSSLYARAYVPYTPLVVGYGNSFSDGEHFATYMLGVAPLEGLLVYTYYWHEDDIKSRTNLNAEYVYLLADEHAVRINFSYTDAPDGFKDMYGVSTDYYFNRYWSAGVSLGRDDNTSYGFNTRYFINEQWSLSALYSNYESDSTTGIPSVTHTYGLGVSLRL